MVWAFHNRDGTLSLWTLFRDGAGEAPRGRCCCPRCPSQRRHSEIAAIERQAAKAKTKTTTPDPEPSGLPTLRDALLVYERDRGSELKSWPHSRKRVDRVFAGLLERPISKLTAVDLQVVADQHVPRQSQTFAVRALRPALKWLAKRGAAPKGLADIEQPVTVNRRRRILSRDELARLLPILMAAKTPHAAIFYFLLLTLRGAKRPLLPSGPISIGVTSCGASQSQKTTGCIWSH